MTPALLIFCGLATSFVCAAGICVLILVERHRARRAAFRLAQAEKIIVPVAPCSLYRSLERLKK